MLSIICRRSSCASRHVVLLSDSKQLLLRPWTTTTAAMQQYYSKKNSIWDNHRLFTTTPKNENTTKKKSSSWQPSSFEIIGGVTTLFFLQAVTPGIIEKMKESDRKYEETDFEDAMNREMRGVSHEIQKSGDLLSLLEQWAWDTATTNRGGKPKLLSSMEDNDKNNKAVKNTVDVVSDVFQNDALQQAIASLIVRVVESQPFQNAIHKLVRDLWNDLVHDPETLQQIVMLLNNAIQNEQIKQSVKQLVLQLLQDQQIYDELTALLIRLGEENEVRLATQTLLTESAHQALNDPEILDHSMEFATDVVGDDVVQRTSGEALRNTVSYAVRPSVSAFLGALGFGLLFLSYSAFRHARSSSTSIAEDNFTIMDMIPLVSHNIDEYIVSPIHAIFIQLPSRFVSKLGSFLYQTFWIYPLTLMKQWLPKNNNIVWSGIGIIGNTSKTVLYYVIVKPPSALYRTIVSFIRRKTNGNDSNDGSVIL